MIHLFRHTPHPCQPWLRPRRRSHRKWVLVPLAGLALVLALTSCSASSSPEPPPVPVTDTEPVGDGLKVIGFAMLGAACVLVLGRMIR